ncbi:MAG: rod shape-determining protein RodA [Acidiferrobacteraceae bacterium]|jgi:rod shape determining protein RodA
MLERWHFDRPLFYALVILSVTGLAIVYSAGGDNLNMTIRDSVHLILGFSVMIGLAQVRPTTIARWSPYLFVVGFLMLIAVLGAGTVSNGARRWLGFGPLRFQPSEIMKLALPMMLAWYLSRGPLPIKLPQLLVSGAVILLPALMIIKEPDLGTAFLIAATGFLVLFLAGMGWRTIIVMAASTAAAIPVLWAHMHQYQRQRVYVLFHPESDPLGIGYHTIQGMIAVGSGGLLGKGWLHSTQAHLDFLPQSSTDFIFAVFSEEFGWLGVLALITLYLFILYRGALIAYRAQDTYSRLLAGGLTLVFFLYFFVNMSMVAGLLPVVGVPLPLISYGGTSVITLMAAFGMLMSIHSHRSIAA